MLCIGYRVFFYVNPTSGLYNFMLAGLVLHGNAILIGSFFGYAAIYYPLHQVFQSKLLNALWVASAIAAIVMLEYAARNGIAAIFTVPFMSIIQNLAVGYLLLFTVCKASWLSKLLNHRILIAIGLWSYSIYIWQQFLLLPGKSLFLSFSNYVQWIFIFPYNIFFVFLIGWLSYRFIEMPLNSVKNKYSFVRK